jgi:acyl-CoA thioesterase-1
MRVVGLPILCLAAVAAMSCESGLAPARPSDGTVRVVVLGDSLAVYPARTEAFPAVLQQMFDAASQPVSVVNAGANGATTADGVRRIDSVLASDVDVLVLALGANDGLSRVPVAVVERNLAAIIETAQRRSVRVLLCGMEALPAGGWNYTIEFHRLFPRLAAEYDVPLVPFLLTGVVFNRELIGPDGVHPNAAGSRRIAETIWPYLEPLVASAAAARKGI